MLPVAAGLLIVVAFPAQTGSEERGPVRDAAAAVVAPPQAAQPGQVWLVERTQEFELYSNGLRVERQFATSGRPRAPRALPKRPDATKRPSDPAGIVFHSSESALAPFEPEHNPVLKRQGEGLLAYIRNHRLYHFVVDRFGRVHRILEESEKADHAGRSVWADPDWVYLDLSDSFVGVAFEARTGDEVDSGQEPASPLSPAQVHAGRVLTEMLRSRHGIPAWNCVTHAQVSVNPRNFRIGYHTDWAGGFPFRELGLPENYDQAPPSLLLFGFQADSLFMKRAGARLRQAVAAAEEQIRREADARGLSVARYRGLLAQSYREAAREVAAAAKEEVEVNE